MKKKLFYTEPECEIVFTVGYELICESNPNGSLEDTTEEDWTF